MKARRVGHMRKKLATKKMAKRSTHTLRPRVSPEVFVEARPMVNLTPGDMIREIRELQGFTQSELSEKTGISQAAISALENGTQTLGLDRAKVLAIALDVHPSVLAFPGWGRESA